MGKIIKMVIAGEGGHGVQVIGEILALAGYMDGKESLYIPNFGVEQRGGVSIAFVQIGEEPIGAPKFRTADLIVTLSRRAVERTKGYMNKHTLYIYDNSNIDEPVINDLTVGIQGWDTVAPEAFANRTGEKAPEDLEDLSTLDFSALGLTGHASNLVPLPAAEIVKAEFTPRVLNILILGAISVFIDTVIDSQSIEKAIEEKLGPKFQENSELRQLNYDAYKKGKGIVQQYRRVVIS